MTLNHMSVVLSTEYMLNLVLASNMDMFLWKKPS